MKIARGVVGGDVLGARAQDPQIGEAEAVGQNVAIGMGRIEMLLRIEEEDRQMAVDLGREMEQNGCFRAEGGDEGDTAPETLDRRGQDRGGALAFERRLPSEDVLACRRGRG